VPHLENATVSGVTEILGLDSLFAEMTLGLGLAILIGNGFALWKARRGERPQGAEGELRLGRVMFLMAIGVVMTAWGSASVFG
jgi:hypothetical protein